MVQSSDPLSTLIPVVAIEIILICDAHLSEYPIPYKVFVVFGGGRFFGIVSIVNILLNT